MADRNFARDCSTLERGLVRLDFTINIGATGAPTLPRSGTGVASVVRNASGDYTVTLEDSYVSCIAVGLTVGTAAGTYSQGGASLNGTAAAQDVTTNKQFKFYTYTTGAAANDLASGCSVHVALLLKNSQV